MRNIIFTKYSNERDNKYKIKTSIVKKDNNVLVVEKSPLTDAAKLHINNMHKSYKLLNDEYNKDLLAINYCELIGETARFEYLEGETLEKLDDLLDDRNFKEIYEQLTIYNNIINSVQDISLFEVTEDFIKVFGNVNLPCGLMASSISNIDIIFSNIILNSKWNLIDYEWTFYFPVPLNYTIYRAIYYYINSSSKRKDLINIGLLKLLGVTEEEIVQYEIMERNFQNYIICNSLTSWGVYNNIHGKCLDIDYILKEAEQRQTKNEVQIYYDYGKDFTETNSTKRYILPDENGKISIKIDLKNNVKRIRIDPSNDYCLIMIDKILGFNKNYYPINYESNGSKLTDKIIIYTTNDSQILVSQIDIGTTFIELEITVKILPLVLLLDLSQYIYSYNNEVKTRYSAEYKVQQLNEINLDLEKQVKELELNKIVDLENIINNLKEESKCTREECDKKVCESEEYIRELKSEAKNLNEQIKHIKKEYEQKIFIRDEYIKNLQNSKLWKFYKKYLIKKK